MAMALSHLDASRQVPTASLCQSASRSFSKPMSEGIGERLPRSSSPHGRIRQWPACRSPDPCNARRSHGLDRSFSFPCAKTPYSRESRHPHPKPFPSARRRQGPACPGQATCECSQSFQADPGSGPWPFVLRTVRQSHLDKGNQSIPELFRASLGFGNPKEPGNHRIAYLVHGMDALGAGVVVIGLKRLDPF